MKNRLADVSEKKSDRLVMVYLFKETMDLPLARLTFGIFIVQAASQSL